MRPYGMTKLVDELMGQHQEKGCRDCGIDTSSKARGRQQGRDEIKEQRTATMTDPILPDGSSFFTASFPLPKDHWLYQNPEWAPPPAPFRMGVQDPVRAVFEKRIKAAARYAIRASTMWGQEKDFDPDALVQNMVVGMLGYFSSDGRSSDSDLPDHGYADGHTVAVTLVGTEGAPQ